MGVIMNISKIIKDREFIDRKNTVEIFKMMRN